MDYYDDYSIYSVKPQAYPWGMKWPKMEYLLVRSTDMSNLRQALAMEYEKTGNLPAPKLKEQEIRLPYPDYIVPKPYNSSVNMPKFYDPLKGFAGMYLPKEPPYLSLVKLDLTDDEAIVDFVNENGLLGIFFHRYDFLTIDHPDRKVKYDDIKAHFSFIPPKGKKRKVSIDALWGIWFGKREYKYDVFPATNKHINDLFFPLLKDFYEPRFMTKYRADDLEKAAVVTKSKSKLEPLENDNAASYVKRFLEIVKPEDGDKALEKILSENMWYFTYCEPLELFKEEAKKFQNLYEDVVKVNNINDKPMKEEITRSEQELLYKVMFNLKRNLQNVNPKPKYDASNRSMVTGWEVPSLLSSYYLMLYLDLVGSRNAKICANERCRRPFIAERKDNTYCGELCQDAAKKRRKYWERKNV